MAYKKTSSTSLSNGSVTTGLADTGPAVVTNNIIS